MTVFFEGPYEWRAWLEKNHDSTGSYTTLIDDSAHGGTIAPLNRKPRG
ncbi:MAG TPA: hypothetical protein VGJ77_20310 [Gaiellaceae bacterium]